MSRVVDSESKVGTLLYFTLLVAVRWRWRLGKVGRSEDDFCSRVGLGTWDLGFGIWDFLLVE